MTMSQQRRDELRALADAEYHDLVGGELYISVHGPDLYALLDDGDALEKIADRPFYIPAQEGQ